MASPPPRLSISTLLTAIGGGLAGAALVLAMAHGDSHPAPPTVATSAPAIADTAATLARLQDRLATLEREGSHAREIQRDADAGPAVSAPTSPAPTATITQSLRELDQRLARLESMLAQNGLPPADTAATLRQQILGLRSGDQEIDLRNRTARIALLRQFLERFPEHEDAGTSLAELLRELVGADTPQLALEMVDRYAPLLPLADWQRAGMTIGPLNAMHAEERVRATYQRMLADPALPKHERANAEFFIAYSFLQQGQHAQARALFARLIDTYSGDPTEQNTVAGARKQLEQIAEAERRERDR